MNRFWWWLADLLSRALEPEEREAVRGDLAETGEAGGHAFVGVLGLVVRRQSALWKTWPPWCMLVGLILPLGVLLCLVSRRIADGSAVYLWLYVNNWDWTFLSNPGFRHELAHYMGIIAIQYFTLFCWSWSSGFVLGYVSRRSIPFQSILFFLFILLGEFLGAPPRHFGHALFYGARDFSNNGGNAAVFELAFYRVVFPLIVQVALVLGPSLWGMCQAKRVGSIRPFLRVILWTVAIATLPTLAIQTGLASVPYQRGISRSIAQVVAYWPVAYIIVAGVARHRTGKVILA